MRKFAFLMTAFFIPACAFSAETTDFALAISQKGYECIKSLVSDQQKEIYAGDREFIAGFPLASYKATVVKDQGSFYLDEIDDYIKNILRTNTPWEPENTAVIQRYIKPGTTALDIGAHIGTHTLVMASSVGPDGKVYAFEPSRKIYRELCMNAALTGASNVIPIRAALGKKRGVISVVPSTFPNNEGSSFVIHEQKGDNAAVVIRLDDLHLENVSFMKIDVENMEGEVLAGALETIKKNRPVMLVEIQGNWNRAQELREDTAALKQETFDRLRSLGYNVSYVGACDYLAIPIEI